MHKNKLERRFLATELRAVGDAAHPAIEGYAAVFNQLSENLGFFREVIKPGAFKRALSEDQDVRALVNHDPSQILGRTKSGTLTLNEDDRGLKFRCNMPDTQAARDLMESIKRGDIDQCSFGFMVKQQRWTNSTESPYPGIGQDDDEQVMIRELHDVDLFDVSAVTYPAYPQTSVDARSLWPNGKPEEIEARELRDKKTKRVDGVDLTSDCFAHVGDPEDPSTWKLPIKFPGDDAKTKSHIRNAIARFGQVKGLNADEKKAAWKKIVAAAKKNGIKISSEQNSLALRKIQDDGTENPAGDDDGDEGDCGCDCQNCQDGMCGACTDPECNDENCDHGTHASDNDEENSWRHRAEMRLKIAQVT